MDLTIKIKQLMLLSTLAYLSACGGGSSSDNVTPAPLPVPVTNTPPIAAADSAVAQNNVPITIDVLANDSDAENSTLSIVSVTTVSEYGTTEIVNNTIIYTPTNNYAGTDSFNYQISDGDLTADASVNITVNHTLTLVGLVTDAPLANATVSATINENGFTTTSDDLGNYQLPIVISDMDTPVIIQALGSIAKNQENIEFIKLMGSGQSLLSLIDEERNLTAGNNKITNITHLSTATYLLAKDKNSNQEFNSNEIFLSYSSELSGENIINTAGFIKLLVDNPEYNIPEGQSILTLLDSTDATISTSAAITNYLTDNGYIDENGQTNQSYNDALAEAINETITDPNVTMEFTTEMLAGNMFTETDASQDGWLTDSGDGLLFNADGTSTTYVNNQTVPLTDAGIYNTTKNWHVSEGSLILTLEPEVIWIDVYYPFTELTSEYGFDSSVQAALMYASYFNGLPYDLHIRADKIHTNNSFTILNESKESRQVNYTGGYNIQLHLDYLEYFYDFDGDIWTGDNPSVSVTKSYQKTHNKASSSLFLDKTLDDISGRWAMPFDHFVGLDFYNGDSIDGLYHDTIEINKSSAISNISAHHFITSLENGVLTLTEGSLVYKVTPIKQSGKSYLAQIEKWYDNKLIYVVSEKIAKFDDSYTLFTSNLVTELPIAQLSYFGSSNVGAWQNNKLKVEQVFGYHFKSDGMLNRGIYTATDDNNETYFKGDDRWIWSQNENIVTLDLASRDRHRSWQVISVDDEGRALVLESSTYTHDQNLDGEISDDEKDRVFVRPRINIIKQTDLSQWAGTWENSQL